MHVDLRRLVAGLWTARRTAAVFATAALLASTDGTAVAAPNAQIAQPPTPNLLLLLDSSGSMENWTDGSADPPSSALLPSGTCTPDNGDNSTSSGTCATTGYTASGVAVSAPNKWGAVIQALAGSPIQSPADVSTTGPVFRWYEMKRTAGSDFDHEYRLSGTPAADVGYALNHHRLATWDAGNNVFCLKSPGYLPAGVGSPALTGVGTPTPAFSVDALDSFPNGSLIGLSPGTIHSALGSVSTSTTGPALTSTCTYALNNDGNIDAVRDLVRFGVMTFDNDIGNGTGTQTSGTSLVVLATPSQSAGLWSYFPGWNGTAAPSPGWIDPNTTLPLPGAASAPYNIIPTSWWSEGSASAACMPLTPYEVGARNPAAPPWEGRFVPFPDGRSGLLQQEATNDEVKQVIEAVRPYGATPIAGMFTDARNYFRLDPNGPEQSDPYVNSNFTGGHGCRPLYIILLTDGGANLDLRETCTPGATTCPFQRPEDIAKDLCWGGTTGTAGNCNGSASYDGVTTYVIGFSFVKFTSPDLGGQVTCQQELAPIPPATLCSSSALSTLCPTPLPATTDPALASCCNLAKIACSGSAGAQGPYFADSASDLNLAFAQILKSVTRQASSHVVPVFATVSGGVAFQSDSFTASYTTQPPAAAGSGTSAPWAGIITENRQACSGSPSTGPKTYPSNEPTPQVAANTREFLDVKNGAGDTGSIRPFLLSVSDGITSTSVTETWATNISNLSPPASDLNVTSFSCPADPISGARLSQNDCATYVEDFYTGTSATLTSSTNGPGGASGYTAGSGVLAQRALNWLGPIINSTPAYVGPPSLALSDNTYRQFADKTTGYGSRVNVLYVETTDGALHALNPDFAYTPSTPTSTSIQEFWTFLPPALNGSILNNIPAADQTLLDASPIVADTVYNRTLTSGTTASPFDWHTTLVSSFGGGGRGYFALDVTQPYPGSGNSYTTVPSSAPYPSGRETNPHFLWQLTTNGLTSAMQPFGTHGATPAITTLFVAAFGAASPAETGVAILPGGSDGQAPTGTCKRDTTGETPASYATGYSPRTYVRSWAAPLATASAISACGTTYAPPNGRTVSVVRLVDGAVLATFANTNDVSTNALGPGGSSIVRIGTNFDSPMTGTPVVYPAGGGRLASAAYVSDADGIIWKLDLSSTNPANWTGKYFFDSFNQGVTGGVAAAAGLPSSDLTAGNLGQPLTAAPILSLGPNSELVLNFATGDQTLLTSKTFRAGSNNTPADEIPVENFVWSVTDSLLSGKAAPQWYVPFTDGTVNEYNINPDTNSASPHYNYGERVTGPMAVYDGVLYFATYWPDDYQQTGGGACQQGQGRIYGLDYFTPRGSCSVGSPTAIGCGGVQRLLLAPPPALPVFPQYIVPGETDTSVAGSLIPGVAITQTQPCLTTTGSPVDTYFGNPSSSFQATTAASTPTLTYVATKNSTSGSSFTNTTAASVSRAIPQPQRNTKIDSWAQVIN